MDYSSHYQRLIYRAQQKPTSGYVEKHHITPRCLGGGEEKSNIVFLSAEEHFMAHKLLVFIYPHHNGLLTAINMMSGSRLSGRCNNKIYGWLRRRFANKISGVPRDKDVCAKISESLRGHKVTETTKEKISSKLKGIKINPEAAAKSAASRKGIKKGPQGPMSEEQKQIRSIANKGKKRSPESIEKTRLSRIGKKASEETRLKQSIAARKRQPRSAESNAKISAALKLRVVSDETRAKISNSKKGHTLLESSRDKIREAHKASGHWVGRKHTEESKEKMRISRANRELKKMQ